MLFIQAEAQALEDSQDPDVTIGSELYFQPDFPFHAALPPLFCIGRLGLLNNFHRRTWFINRNPSLLLRWSSVLLVEPTQLHTVSHDSHTRDPLGRTPPIAETRAHMQTRAAFRRNIHTVLSVADCRNTVRVAEPSGLNLHGRLCCGRHDIRGSSERVSGNDIGDGDVGTSWKIWSLGHQFNLRSFHIQLRLSDLA